MSAPEMHPQSRWVKILSTTRNNHSSTSDHLVWDLERFMTARLAECRENQQKPDKDLVVMVEVL